MAQKKVISKKGSKKPAKKTAVKRTKTPSKSNIQANTQVVNITQPVKRVYSRRKQSVGENAAKSSSSVIAPQFIHYAAPSIPYYPMPPPPFGREDGFSGVRKSALKVERDEEKSIPLKTIPLPSSSEELGRPLTVVKDESSAEETPIALSAKDKVKTTGKFIYKTIPSISTVEEAEDEEPMKIRTTKPLVEETVRPYIKKEDVKEFRESFKNAGLGEVSEKKARKAILDWMSENNATAKDFRDSVLIPSRPQMIIRYINLNKPQSSPKTQKIQQLPQFV
jgi:hypothetical protein